MNNSSSAFGIPEHLGTPLMEKKVKGVLREAVINPPRLPAFMIDNALRRRVKNNRGSGIDAEKLILTSSVL